MKISEVLADKLYVILTTLFVSLLLSLFLYSLQISASVIILLVWLYLCGNILILGNVFNCVWYRRKKIRYLKKLREQDAP